MQTNIDSGYINNIKDTHKISLLPNIDEELELLELVLKEHTSLSSKMVTWMASYASIFDIELSSYNESLNPFFEKLNNNTKVKMQLVEMTNVLLKTKPSIKFKTEDIPRELTNLHLDLFSLIDAHTKEKYKDYIYDDAVKHLEFLMMARRFESVSLFNEYILWVNSLFLSLKIPTKTLIRFLVTLKEILLNSEISDAVIYIDNAVINLLSKLNVNYYDSHSYVTNKHANAYIQLLMQHKPEEATDLILDVQKSGMDFKELFIECFQNTQYEIGRLWHLQKLSIADEHYCTFETKKNLSIVTKNYAKKEAKNKKILSTCVSDEYHDLGIQIISCALNLEGWESIYLGSNVPIKAVLEAIEKYKIDVLAISVSIIINLGKADELIQRVKEVFPKIKIIIGGSPFNFDTDLVHKINADGMLKSVNEIEQLEQMLL